MSTAAHWEPLPLDAWEDSKTTLHLYCQIVGKIRLKAHPKLNHWWHVTLYVSPRGLTTGAIPWHGSAFALELDLIDHTLWIRSAGGPSREVPLGLSMAEVYAAIDAGLKDLGVDVAILARPYAHASTTPFPADRAPRAYDRDRVHRYWRTLVAVDGVFKTFSGRFVGKQTPVHLYWHSFDLAVTRFSGRAAPPREGGLPSDAEAYSHEVISFGFWPGDAAMPEPAFYSYTYPEPAGLAETPLAPPPAWWNVQDGNAMALLRYDDLRRSADPAADLLAFMESAYRAGAERAGWPVADLDHAAAVPIPAA